MEFCAAEISPGPRLRHQAGAPRSRCAVQHRRGEAPHACRQGRGGSLEFCAAGIGPGPGPAGQRGGARARRAARHGSLPPRVRGRAAPEKLLQTRWQPPAPRPAGPAPRRGPQLPQLRRCRRCRAAAAPRAGSPDAHSRPPWDCADAGPRRAAWRAPGSNYIELQVHLPRLPARRAAGCPHDCSAAVSAPVPARCGPPAAPPPSKTRGPAELDSRPDFGYAGSPRKGLPEKLKMRSRDHGDAALIWVRDASPQGTDCWRHGGSDFRTSDHRTFGIRKNTKSG